MKSTDSFQIDQSWWKKNKPKVMKKTGLGQAMANYNSAKTRAMTLNDKETYPKIGEVPCPFEAAIALLKGELTSKVDVAKTAAGKSRLYADTFTVLGKADAVLKSELSQLTKAKKAFEKRYENYLKKILSSLSDMQTASRSEKKQAEKEIQTCQNKAKAIKGGASLLVANSKKGASRPEDIQQIVKQATAFAEEIKAVKKDLSARVKKLDVKLQKDGDPKTNTLLPKDKSRCEKLRDSCTEMLHDLATMTDQLRVELVAVNQCVDELKNIEGDTKTELDTIRKSLAKLASALTKQETSTRKLVNDLISLIHRGNAMLKHPELLVSQGVSQDQFASVHQEDLKTGKKVAEQAAKVYADSKKIVETTYDKYSKTRILMFFKEDASVVDEKLNGLKDYSEHCVRHLKSLGKLTQQINQI